MSQANALWTLSHHSEAGRVVASQQVNSWVCMQTGYFPVSDVQEPGNKRENKQLFFLIVKAFPSLKNREDPPPRAPGGRVGCGTSSSPPRPVRVTILPREPAHPQCLVN